MQRRPAASARVSPSASATGVAIGVSAGRAAGRVDRGRGPRSHGGGRDSIAWGGLGSRRAYPDPLDVARRSVVAAAELVDGVAEDRPEDGQAVAGAAASSRAG